MTASARAGTIGLRAIQVPLDSPRPGRVPGGQPHMHVLPPSKQQFLGRIIGADKSSSGLRFGDCKYDLEKSCFLLEKKIKSFGAAAAAPAGLEGAGLHDQLVLDGEPLTPRRYQNRQGARQFAVFLQDQKWRRALLARVALIRHIVSSRNRIYPRCLVLYVPRKHPYSYIYAKVCINEYIYATYI